MEDFRVRVLNGTYNVEGMGVRIDLFGRTKAGRSLTMRYNGFYPYFYIVSPDQNLIQDLMDDPDVVRYSMRMLYVNNVKKDCIKVEIKHPFKVPDYKKRYQNRFKILAADIPFIQRFFYDLNLASSLKVSGEIVTDAVVTQNYTTDLVVDVKEIKFGHSFRTDLKILSFDLENSIRTGRILCICCAIRAGMNDIRYEVLQGIESDILMDFTKLVKTEDPDILTGYNIDNYDIPYIRKRMVVNGMGNSLMLSRNLSPVTPDKFIGWNCKGRVIVDAWWQVKKEKRPKRESLSYVSTKFLGVSKLDVDSSKMDEEWEKDPEKVIKYCKRDAELPILLLEKLGIIQKYIDLSQVSRLPFGDVIKGRTSTLIDSLLIREAEKKNVGIPLSIHQSKKDSITGGYVHTLRAGLYHWVCVLDFKSMYPSIIIANNICFSTKSSEGDIFAPNGARFLSRERKEGILPDILKKLMHDRELAKDKSKEAKDEDERRYYEGFQQAIKVLMNAFYGVFASNFYRFTDKSIGGAITSFARQNITRIIEELKTEGIHVLYSDTDSIFVQSPFSALDTSVAFGSDLAKRFSKEGAVLEFEKILETFFAHGAKKRYVGKVVWPVEGLLVRGYEIRRSDSFDLLTDTLKKVFSHILSVDDEDAPKKALKLVRSVIADTKRGLVDPNKLIISK
ncbi:MAG: DNA polymerase domain-containing protein, partial [Candidatus Thermoplasmatota archaeon]|nr:DNA polymerase domain-containing protein [Candidatus Thermoplasmatota archaeon]